MPNTQTIHATCVALDGKAVLIQGASGRGKSALGLMLLGMGCVLVADDRVTIHADGKLPTGDTGPDRGPRRGPVKR